MVNLVIRPYDESSSQPIKINKIEEHYNVKFIGDFCLKAKGGGWCDFPVAIFYQPNPDISQGHTHYLGVFVDEYGRLILTNGSNAFDDPIDAVIANDGEVIFSKYRHHFVQSYDGSVFIDGGRDYLRCGGDVDFSKRLVKLRINQDKLEIIPETIHPDWNQQ